MKSKSEDVLVKHLTTLDLTLTKNLFCILQEVFGVDKLIGVSDNYAKNLLANRAFICIAATYKSNVVGGLTAYELPMYSGERSEVMVFDIAVKPEFQRKGIGAKLLQLLKEYCKENNINTIFVDAIEDDEHALEFYRATGANEQKVVQFTYTEY